MNYTRYRVSNVQHLNRGLRKVGISESAGKSSVASTFPGFQDSPLRERRGRPKKKRRVGSSSTALNWIIQQPVYQPAIPAPMTFCLLNILNFIMPSAFCTQSNPHPKSNTEKPRISCIDVNTKSLPNHHYLLSTDSLPSIKNTTRAQSPGSNTSSHWEDEKPNDKGGLAAVAFYRNPSSSQARFAAR